MEQTNFTQPDQSYHPRHHIKVYVWVALVIAAFLVAINGYVYFLRLSYLWQGAESARQNEQEIQELRDHRFGNKEGGTLRGKVSIGPNCPVQRGDIECTPSPEAYAAREFIVFDSNQKEVVRFYADANGDYSINLLAGTYSVVSAKMGMGYMSGDLPATVIIKAGQSSILNIGVDTGIR